MERIIRGLALLAITTAIPISPAFAQAQETEKNEFATDINIRPIFNDISNMIMVICLRENDPAEIYFDNDHVLVNGIIAFPHSDIYNFGIVMGSPERNESILVDAGHEREVGTQINISGDISSNLRVGVDVQKFLYGIAGGFVPGRVSQHTRSDTADLTIEEAQRTIPIACQHVSSLGPGLLYHDP